MEMKFYKLFSVSVTHNFFTDKIFRGFIFSPAIETLKILKDYNLLFRNTENGFEVHANCEEIIVDEETRIKPFKNLERNIRLRFLIRLNDPYYLNYSELPIEDITGKIYRFNNISLNLINESNPALVKDTDSKFVSASDLVPLSAALFNLEVAPDFNKDEVLIMNASGNEVIKMSDDSEEKFFKLIADNETEKVLQIDLRNFPQGYYEIFNGEEMHPIYLDSAFSFKDAIGLVEIFSGNDVNEANRFSSGGYLNSRDYLIPIDNRSLGWKFTVVRKNFPELYKMENDEVIVNIKLEEVGISKIDGELKTFGNGEDSLEFTLPERKITEQTDSVFRLINTEGNANDILINSISLPSYKNITRDNATQENNFESITFL